MKWLRWPCNRVQALRVFTLFAAAASWAFASPVSAESLSPRDAALRVMGAAIYVPYAVAYCTKKHDLPEADHVHAANWNKKHDAIMRKAIAVVEKTGGMKAEERAYLDKVASSYVIKEIDDGNPKANCRALVDGLKTNRFDLGQMPHLKDALSVLAAN